MVCDDVFKSRIILDPERFRILDYPRKPVAVFNPGVVLVGEEVHIFPRLIFDYYKYTSSIGHFKMHVDEISSGNIPPKIDVRIVMWPKGREDLLGVEDPRAHLVGDEIWLLYTAKGFDEKGERRDLLGLAKFKDDVERVGYFALDMGNGPFYPKSNKDSTFLNIDGRWADILTRPHLEDNVLGLWRGRTDLENLIIEDLKTLKKPSDHEEKLGWSTNAVKVENGWVVGWHAVLKDDLSYRNGLAFIGDEESFTDYVLCPKGLLEEYGDRAQVIFGCGLILTQDDVIWIGGVSDYAIGIFKASRWW